MAMYSGRSCRRTVYQSQVMTTRNPTYTTAKAAPVSAAALLVNTASRARIAIWTKTKVRVRPSSRPWSS